MGEGASRLSEEQRKDKHIPYSYASLSKGTKPRKKGKRAWLGIAYQLQTLEGCTTDPSPQYPGSSGPLATPEGFSCGPQPHISISGADCEEAMDICFYVSHIHLHTFYIFIYEGLSKLFSAPPPPHTHTTKTLRLLSLVLSQMLYSTFCPILLRTVPSTIQCRVPRQPCKPQC